MIILNGVLQSIQADFEKNQLYVKKIKSGKLNNTKNKILSKEYWAKYKIISPKYV